MIPSANGPRDERVATRAGRVLRAALVAIGAIVTAAPTAGDIGSCGQEAVDLDPLKFFGTKQSIDCERCADCGIESAACDMACSPGLVQSAFPPGCYPLVHDGEVCLNALLSASCDEYESFMADGGGSVPTECNFCPPSAAPRAATRPVSR